MLYLLELLELKVCANGFLYNMARAMAGTVVYAAEGKFPPEEIAQILLLALEALLLLQNLLLVLLGPLLALLLVHLGELLRALGLRIFDDENGVMNRSVVDVDGEILAVSQFTLTASTKKGNRPSYIRAAGHELAVPLYDKFCVRLSEIAGRPVHKGVFGADMQCALVNDGPVTIIIDSRIKE